MDNSGRDHIVYSLVQGGGELQHMRHEKRILVGDSVQLMDENWSSNLVLFQNALAEFETEYGHPFTMEQLLLDEEALRETLEEEAMTEKELEERIKQEQAHDELFRLEFRVKSDSEYESD
ncbi:hypothetical protein Tco_0335639 [Tanacetum coccineum]